MRHPRRSRLADALLGGLLTLAPGALPAASLDLEVPVGETELRGLLQPLLGTEGSSAERETALVTRVLDYYAWRDWTVERVSLSGDAERGWRLRVEATPPLAVRVPAEAAGHWEPATEPARVAAPRAAAGAREESTGDPLLQDWLQTGARVLVAAGERRLYLRREDGGVHSYPVAVGTPATPTPPGRYTIEAISADPTWYPTPRIRRAYAARGRELPPSIPPGRGNPLGSYFVRLQNAIGIHGTNQPSSIGQAASFGCIRLHDADVRELVSHLRPGETVLVVAAAPAIRAQASPLSDEP